MIYMLQLLKSQQLTEQRMTDMKLATTINRLGHTRTTLDVFNLRWNVTRLRYPFHFLPLNYSTQHKKIHNIISIMAKQQDNP